LSIYIKLKEIKVRDQICQLKKKKIEDQTHGLKSKTKIRKHNWRNSIRFYHFSFLWCLNIEAIISTA